MDINIHDTEGMTPEDKQELENSIRDILKIIKEKYGAEVLESLQDGASFLRLDPETIPSLEAALQTALRFAQEDNTTVILSVGSVFCLITTDTNIEELKKELFQNLPVTVDEEGRILVKL